LAERQLCNALAQLTSRPWQLWLTSDSKGKGSFGVKNMNVGQTDGKAESRCEAVSHPLGLATSATGKSAGNRNIEPAAPGS
jgi:hypothetical protein